MKKTLILEKDKEGQRKYYLSYPKPNVLDMKWENRDINVAEWANIPKIPLLLNGDPRRERCSAADRMLNLKC